MSENTQTVVERAREEAERWYPHDFRTVGGNLAKRRAFLDGATFAATITPEQVEAAARVKIPLLPFAVLVIVFWPINQVLSAVRAVRETVRSWLR